MIFFEKYKNIFSISILFLIKWNLCLLCQECYQAMVWCNWEWLHFVSGLSMFSLKHFDNILFKILLLLKLYHIQHNFFATSTKC
jgi:hypothetical protein